MKIFIFNKPKQTIINILFIMGLVSLFVSILAIGTVVLWKYYPDTVNKIDKMIPDFYGDKIKSLYKKAKEEKDSSKKLEYFSELYDELEDVSTLNKYYTYRQESAKWLIDYYIKNDDKQKAFKIAKEWKKNYPYDFVGKFTYIDVSSLVDKNLSSTYMDELYKKHNDIREVVDKYMSYQLKDKEYNKALEAFRTAKFELKNSVRFQIYYKDKTKSFSENQSVKYSDLDYTLKDNIYYLKFKTNFKSFNGIRVDIDTLPMGTFVSDVTLSINQDKIQIKNTNQLASSKNGYEIIGDDPYFIFDILSKFTNYQGFLDIEFRCKIKRNNVVEKQILQNSEWQLFFDKGNGFNEKDSSHFSLEKDNNQFVSNDNVDFQNVSKIRLDFPSLKGLKINDFKIIINQNLVLTKKNITQSNNVKINKSLMITGIDPYIVINIDNQININDIRVDIDFNGDKDE